jgi:hypothetical protein
MRTMTGEVVVSAASRHSSIACRAPDGEEVRSACRWRQARQGDHQAASVCVDGGQCGQGLVRESDRLGGVARGAAPFGAVAQQQQRMVGKPPGPVLMARRGQVKGRPVDRYGVVGIGGRPDLEGRARHEQTRQARQMTAEEHRPVVVVADEQGGHVLVLAFHPEGPAPVRKHWGTRGFAALSRPGVRPELLGRKPSCQCPVSRRSVPPLFWTHIAPYSSFELDMKDRLGLTPNGHAARPAPCAMCEGRAAGTGTVRRDPHHEGRGRSGWGTR